MCDFRLHNLETSGLHNPEVILIFRLFGPNRAKWKVFYVGCRKTLVEVQEETTLGPAH